MSIDARDGKGVRDGELSDRRLRNTGRGWANRQRAGRPFREVDRQEVRESLALAVSMLS